MEPVSRTCSISRPPSDSQLSASSKDRSAGVAGAGNRARLNRNIVRAHEASRLQGCWLPADSALHTRPCPGKPFRVPPLLVRPLGPRAFRGAAPGSSRGAFQASMTSSLGCLRTSSVSHLLSPARPTTSRTSHTSPTTHDGPARFVRVPVALSLSRRPTLWHLCSLIGFWKQRH